MAKPYNTNSLGYKLSFNGPETVEEYDQKAGRAGACLQDACDNVIYRGVLPEWQDAFGSKLEEKFGARKVDEKRTSLAKARSETPDKVKDVLETWTTYHRRVVADLGDDAAAKTELAQLAQSTAATVEVDPSPSKRAGGIGKEYKDKADSLLTLPTDQLETKVTKMLDNVGDDFQLERNEANENRPSPESLARLVKAHITKLMESDI